MRAPLYPILLTVLVAACDDSQKPKNPFEPPPKDTVAPPKDSAPVKPSGPPQFRVGAEGPKIGWHDILIDKPDGRERLKAEVVEQKQWIDGKKVPVFVDRKAKLPWVVAFLEELGHAGATGFTVTTETRKEYSKTLEFVPSSKLTDPIGCTLVGMILADYTAAIWNLEGSPGSKSPKGMAGPDLTVAQDIIERRAKACKTSSAFFVSSAEGIDWGLTYDLAATAAKVTEPKLDTFVLLSKTPVAGRKVAL